MTGSDIETFRECAQPLAVRVADQVGRLSIAEKIGLLHQHQAAIPRLGIGPFVTGTEALHGLAWLGPATVFPQAVGLASTWEPDLVRAVGTAVSRNRLKRQLREVWTEVEPDAPPGCDYVLAARNVEAPDSIPSRYALFNQRRKSTGAPLRGSARCRHGCRLWHFALSLIGGTISCSIDIRQHC